MTEPRRPGSVQTEAGFGSSIQRSRLDRLRLTIPGFVKKNRGLLSNPKFWQLMLRLGTARVAGRPWPDDGPVMFVATHHKVMTTYFHAVLRLLAMGSRIPFERVNFEQPRADTRLFLSMQSKFDLNALNPYRGIHLIRDPRDMIVSAYHYHKWTHEEWVHRPDENGVSYQEKLNRADKKTGIFMQIDTFIYSYRETLENWDVSDPCVLEVAYEDLMGDTRDGLYKKMFEHLGFEQDKLALALDLMRLFEADSRTGRKTGKTEQKSHIRSGRSGQWREELDAEHIAYIEQELGHVLRKFGYAQ